MNRNKKRRFVALLLALSAVFSVLCLSGCSGDNKIVLYVNRNGANDGENYLGMPEVQKEIRSIMTEKGLDYIEHTAYGVFNGDDEEAASDGNTLVYTFFGEKERVVLSAALKIKNSLGIKTVLMEKSTGEVTNVES